MINRFLNYLSISRREWWLLATFYLILVGLSGYVLSIKPLVLFPNERNAIAYYDDYANGGQSEVLSSLQTDSAYYLNFVLKEGFVSPYVGLTIGDSAGMTINAWLYNRLDIEAKVHNLKGLSVSLYTKREQLETLHQSNLEFSEDRNHLSVSLDKLRVPDWWYTAEGMSEYDQIDPNLSHIIRVNIGSIHLPDFSGQSAMTIYTIRFQRDNTLVFTIIVCIALLMPLILVLRIRLHNERNPSKMLKEECSVDVSQEPFMTIINQRFNDPTLTLDQVSSESGINGRKIAAYIQQHFDCNFKSYLNGLRISESKRLLLHTEYNIGEVAYKVGFSTQSHFNRVFKGQEGINPSEFRLKNRNAEG